MGVLAVIASGKRIHNVQVQENRSTQNGMGQPIDNWVTVFEQRVAIEPQTGRELAIALQMNTASTHKVTALYDSRFTTKNRIVYCGRNFDVNHIANVDERNRELILTCGELSA